MARVEFGEWLPDLPINENPGAVLAKNCIPRARSYKEFRGIAANTDALSLPANSNFWARSSGGTIHNFAGDASNLYLLDATLNWDNVNKVSSAYSATAWDFSRFRDRIVATDGSTTLQYYDMDTSSLFADLAGSPPICDTLGVVRDFLVLGNITGSSDVGTDGLFWSGFNNTELWTPSLATQSGFQALRGNGGKVQRIVPGTLGIIFQERSIQGMEYVGSPTIWRWDEITTEHGTHAPRGVAWSKDFVFYYSTEGFMQLDRRSLQIQPIGVEKVNDWFLKEVAPSAIVDISAAIDRTRHLVHWAFKSSSSAVQNDRILTYNYAIQRWSYSEIATQYIGESASVSANLDTLDALLGGNIDTASINVDDDSFAGGVVTFSGFGIDNKMGSFVGTPLVAEIDTSEFSVEDRVVCVDSVRPIVTNNDEIQVASVTKNLAQNNAVLGPYVSTNEVGQANIRKSARYHRLRVKISGGFDYAQRVEYDVKDVGLR